MVVRSEREEGGKRDKGEGTDRARKETIDLPEGTGDDGHPH